MPPRQNGTARRAPPRRTQSAQRGAAPSSNGGRRVPGWLWAIGGIVAGFFIAKHFLAGQPTDSPGGLAAIVTRPTPSEPQQAAQRAAQQGAQSPQQQEAQSPPQQEGAQDPANNMPTFEFYTLLPESEVIAPSAPSTDAAPAAPAAATRTPPPAAAPQTPPTAAPSQPARREAAQSSAPAASNAAAQSGASYMLQAASFRSQTDANTMAGRFRDLGLITQVSQVKTGDGTTWYRVQAGPYSDSGELARARGLMQARGVDPLMIRQR